MSTVSRVNGFRLVKSLAGGFNAQTEMMFVPASDASVIMVGDLVKLAGDARSPTGSPTATRITAATDIPVGVVVGITFEGMGDAQNVPPVDNLNTPVYRRANQDRYIMVCTDPNAVYEVEFATASASAAAITANVGSNGQPGIAAGNTASGASGMNLSATLAVTATLPLKIVGFPYRPDNTPGDTYFAYWVKLNPPTYGTGTGTAGI